MPATDRRKPHDHEDVMAPARGVFGGFALGIVVWVLMVLTLWAL